MCIGTLATLTAVVKRNAANVHFGSLGKLGSALGMSALPSKADMLGVQWAKGNCKPKCKLTARHSMVLDITCQDGQQKNPEREHTLSY
jgi:hypothetical protein